MVMTGTRRFSRQKTVFVSREAKIFKKFKWTFENFVNAIKLRLKEEKDTFILVTGDTGSGKSHLTGNFCLKFFAKEDNFIKGEGKMFEKSNFIVDPAEFAAKMISEKGSVLWIDEGRDAVNRQQWFSEINQIIASRKNRNRKRFNTYFLLMPYEVEMDPKLSRHLTIWIWIRRGVGEIYVKSSGKKGGRGLDIQSIIDREEKWRKENPGANFVIPTIHPEYIGRIFFSKLTEGFRREYDELVERKHAVGELTEEEKLEFGIIEKLSPETCIRNAIFDLKEGKIKTKSDLWDTLKEQTQWDDDKLLKKINFYLNIEGMKSFGNLLRSG